MLILGPDSEPCRRVQKLLKLVLEIDVEETRNAQGQWLMENSYPAEDNMEEDGSDVSDGRRRRRYRNIPMEEASDPDVWMEENHYSSDSSSSSVSGNADNSAAPGYSRYGGEHCLNQMMSARDALLSLIRERLDSAYERGDMEAADELEQMLANYGCL